MKKYAALLVVLLVYISIISGCKKDDEPNQPTRTDILTGREWKFQEIWAFNQNLTNLGITDYFGELANSNFKFNRDGSYTATNRTTNDEVTGKWEFNSDETQLILNKGTSNENTLGIVTLTDKNLDLRQTIDPASIDAATLPLQFRLLFSTVTQPFPVDIKLIPA